MISPWYQLGYVIPHLYTDLDAYQFYRVAPEGMMLVTTGLDLKEYSLAAVERELPVLWQRFDLLAKKKVDRISLSGVPVASALGRKKMREILAEGEARTGLPCDTDLEAHIATLQHFGATRIALATRWPEAMNAALTRYLAEAGIEVIACRSRARSLDGEQAVQRGRRPSARARAGRPGPARGAGCSGAADAGRPVVRHPCRAAARGRVRPAGAAQHPLHDVGGAPCRRASACCTVPIRAGARCWPASHWGDK